MSSLGPVTTETAYRAFGRATGACPNCWAAWVNARPRPGLGYCWHGKIAWRLTTRLEMVSMADVTRDEHRAMMEYQIEMDSLQRPANLTL